MIKGGSYVVNIPGPGLSLLLKFLGPFLLLLLFSNIHLFIWLHWVLLAACGIYFPDQGSNPGPLHWECRVLANTPPRRSPSFLLEFPSQLNSFILPGIRMTIILLIIIVSMKRIDFVPGFCDK